MRCVIVFSIGNPLTSELMQKERVAQVGFLRDRIVVVVIVVVVVTVVVRVAATA